MRLEFTALFDDRYGHPGEFAVAKCAECGFMSTEPRLVESDLPALYSTYYPRRRSTADDVRRSAQTMAIATKRGRLRARLLTGQWSAHYEVRPGMRVLDYGCGDCTSLLEMRALGAQPYGLEVDPNVRGLATALGVTVHIGSLESLPEADGTFDAVTLSQVIEHVTDPEGLLRSLWTKLKPGGMIVLTTPNSRALSRRVFGRRWLHWHIPFHQNHFHRAALHRLLERAGFRVEKSRTFTPVPWWEYQLEMLLRAPKRGRAHPYFERGESVIQASHLGRALLRPGRIVAAFIARAVDAMGLGDSLLVVARKAPG
jgi:SAM-dependent methyltransferase